MPKKKPLDNDTTLIHAFALPNFGPARHQAIQDAIQNVRNVVKDCLSFYKSEDLVNLATNGVGPLQGESPTYPDF